MFPAFFGWWGRRAADSTVTLVDHERRITQTENAIKALVTSSTAGIAELRGLLQAQNKAQDEFKESLATLIAAAAAHATFWATWRRRAGNFGRFVVYALVGVWVIWQMKHDPKFLKDHWSAITWVLEHLPI